MKTTFVLTALLLLTNHSFAEKRKILYSYTLWIGDNVDEEYFIRLSSEKGIKFISVMSEAAAKDVKFSFEFSSSLFGKFITKIADETQDPSK